MAMPHSIFKPRHTLRLKNRLLSLETPLVMGILNITPDSFFAGSRLESTDAALQKASIMLEEGAGILDIGGYSSRPGASDISIEEELERVLPIIEAIKKEFPQSVISIDTFRSTVAAQAVASGADIINDISGGQLDAQMFETVGKLGVPYILMHMKGTPQTMKQLASYEDLIQELITYFHQRIHALRKYNCRDIILDPGFGFAKTIKHNYQLLDQLDTFKLFELPILAGLSRKSMIYKKLNIEPSEALNGTTALNTLALSKGAMILRVHDVKAAKQIIDLVYEPKP